MLMATMEDLRNSSHPRLTLETSFLKIIEAGNVVAVSTLLGQVDKILAELPDSKEPNRPAQIEQPEEKETAQARVADEKKATPPSGKTDGRKKETAARQAKKVELHPHKKDIRKDWLEFIEYVKDRKLWMAQNLQRADSVKQEDSELHLTYGDPANCTVLRQKENLQQLSEFVLDFFQQSIKIRFIVPDKESNSEDSNGESPQRKRRELADDPLVIMAAEIFNGQIGDIRIGPRSR
jgi:DNA polymerase-3 subunit gamma/tau